MIDPDVTNLGYLELIRSSTEYKSLNKYQQLAYERSLNVFFPFSEVSIIGWDAKHSKTLDLSLRNEFAMYLTRYKKDLNYDPSIHNDVDSITYHIMYNNELSSEEKNELIAINQYRFLQNFEEVARKVRAHYNRQQARRGKRGAPTKKAQEEKDKFKQNNLVPDKLEMVGREMIVDESYLTFPVVACTLEDIDVTEVFAQNIKFDTDVSALLVSQISPDNIVLMDTEYEQIESNGKWYRNYKELAIINAQGELMYNEYGSGINKESVLDKLNNKLVLVKGIGAELDYVYGKYSSLNTTNNHREINKNLKKPIVSIFFDLIKFHVRRYNGYHISANELEFFRQEWLEKQAFILDKLARDSFLRRRAQIMFIRIASAWQQIFPELKHVIANMCSMFTMLGDHLGSIDLQFLSVSIQDEIKIKKKLYDLMLNTNIVYTSIGCFFHFDKNCKRCRLYKLKRITKDSLIMYDEGVSDHQIDRFFTYIATVNRVKAGALYWFLKKNEKLCEYEVLQLYKEFLQVNWEDFVRRNLEFFS